MAFDRQAILEQCPKEITDILRATAEDTKDVTARMKVATTLARSLLFAKTRTGEERTPADTEVYKLATVIRKARSQKQFDQSAQGGTAKGKVSYPSKIRSCLETPLGARDRDGSEERAKKTGKKGRGEWSA